ncbi:MAG TPA: NAD(P)-dependent oxidoreductase [Planctomycetota bacterium]|nr:NAD(P)-dependent oxidoreductase [Planctomycetota bacterium]
MRILVASPVFPSALEELRKNHDVVVAVDAPAHDLKRLIVDRHALVFRSGVQITADVMRCAPDLELLIRAGSGLDNLDMDYVRQKGLQLTRIPEPGARAVAELAFGFMLALSRQISLADGLLRRGKWAKHQIQGHLLEDKTLGIYGAGNIGCLVGQMGASWGMRVIGCVEHPSTERAAELATRAMQLASPDEVLSRSDYLSLHVPLKDSTRNLLDDQTIARMKPGAFLINMSRGGVVVEAALARALHSGHIAGAGVDVHAQEGQGAISPLAEFENVILTPHMGAGTIDSQRKIGERVLQIVGAHRGRAAGV